MNKERKGWRAGQKKQYKIRVLLSPEQAGSLLKKLDDESHPSSEMIGHQSDCTLCQCSEQLLKAIVSAPRPLRIKAEKESGLP